jgi:hypothetical protein
MIVELLDYRPELSREPPLRVPIKSRVVLHPSAETLWADICSVNQRLGGTMSDNDALELESRLLVREFYSSRPNSSSHCASWLLPLRYASTRILI